MTEQEVKMLEGTFRSDGKRCGCDLNCVLDGKCTGVNRRDRRWARRHGQCAYARKPVANAQVRRDSAAPERKP